jgi:dephospho-CoA kinase
VDRTAVRRIISTDRAQRERLEGLVHPGVARRRDALMAVYQRDPGVKAIIWDSPLLYEAGLADQCDGVIFVDADREVRLSRVARDRGWTAEDLVRLEKSQKPLDFKRRRADYRVVNNSDIDVLRERVKDVFSEILSGK